MKRHLPGLCLVLTATALVVTGSPARAQGNLLTNPGFESSGGSYDGWTVLGSGAQLSLPENDNIIRTGVAASKVFGEFAGCPGPPTFSVGGYKQSFTPTAGMEYVLTGYSFVSSGDVIPGSSTCDGNRAVAKIAFFNALDEEISGNEVVIGDWSTPTDAWRFFSVSLVAPPSAVLVEADILFLQPDCDAGSVFIDDLNFRENPVPAETNLLANPSFDTNLAGWTTFENVYYEGNPALVRTPTGACKLYSSFASGLPSGMFQTFPASPGSAWKMSVHSRSVCGDEITGTNDNLVVAKIVFRDATNVEIGASETVILDSASPLGTWTEHSVVSTNAPDGTVAVEPFILFVSPTLQPGAAWVDDVSFRQIAQTGIPETASPRSFTLHQNRPNPFSPATRIDFELGESSDVEITIYDVAGRRVATLFEGRLGPGGHHVDWDGRADSGPQVAAGIYRYVLKTTSGVTSRSMVRID